MINSLSDGANILFDANYSVFVVQIIGSRSEVFNQVPGRVNYFLDGNE